MAKAVGILHQDGAAHPCLQVSSARPVAACRGVSKTAGVTIRNAAIGCWRSSIAELAALESSNRRRCPGWKTRRQHGDCRPRWRRQRERFDRQHQCQGAVDAAGAADHPAETAAACACRAGRARSGGGRIPSPAAGPDRPPAAPRAVAGSKPPLANCNVTVCSAKRCASNTPPVAA